MQHDLFDIPVYRLSESEYEKSFNDHFEKYLTLNINRDYYEKNPEYQKLVRAAAVENFGGMWRFNEIIGYIRLYVLGSQIRGYYYENDVKNHLRTRKKQFVYRTHKLAIEIEVYYPWDNKNIYNCIKIYLDNCKKALSSRFIDTSNFDLVGPHVNWASLFNSFPHKNL